MPRQSLRHRKKQTSHPTTRSKQIFMLIICTIVGGILYFGFHTFISMPENLSDVEEWTEPQDQDQDQLPRLGEFYATITQKTGEHIINLSEVKLFLKGREINSTDLQLSFADGDASSCKDGNLETVCFSQNVQQPAQLTIVSPQEFDEVAVFNGKDGLERILGAMIMATIDGGKIFFMHEVFREVETVYLFRASFAVHLEPSLPIEMSCEDGVIRVASAVFGNCVKDCDQPSNCSLDVTADFSTQCNGNNLCTLPPPKVTLRNYALPCPTEENYVIVHFSCSIPAAQLLQIQSDQPRKFSSEQPGAVFEYVEKDLQGCGGYSCPERTDNLWKDGCILSTESAYALCNEVPQCVCVGLAAHSRPWMARAIPNTLLVGTNLYDNKDWLSHAKVKKEACDMSCSPEIGACDANLHKCYFCQLGFTPDIHGICRANPDNLGMYMVQISHKAGSGKVINLAEVQLLYQGNLLPRSDIKLDFLNRDSQFPINHCNDGNVHTFCHLDAASGLTPSVLRVFSKSMFDQVVVINTLHCCQYRSVGLTITATVDGGQTWMLSEKINRIDSNYMYNPASCQDLLQDWTDSEGLGCKQYAVLGLCTPDGNYGTRWDPNLYKTFRNYAKDGISATQACCSCGGGIRSQ